MAVLLADVYEDWSNQWLMLAHLAGLDALDTGTLMVPPDGAEQARTLAAPRGTLVR